MRRKTKRAPARRRRSYRKAKAKTTNMFGKIAPILAPILYGAGREKVSDMIANSEFGKKLPASQFTDEGVMLGVGFVAKKLGLGKGVGGSIIRAGKQIELSRIGATAINMYSENTGVSGGTSNDEW